MRAVEIAQAVRIVGEVGGHPVEDDAVAMPVQGVDEVGEVVGRAESRRRGEVADRLVTPAPVERVFGDRHQLDVREVGVVEVGDELVGQLAVVEKRTAVLAASFPRAQVNLVDGDRLVEALPLGRVGEPFLVVPGKLRDVPDDRGRPGPHLRGEAVGVGLVNEIAVVAALDLVLVDFALAEVGDEDLPDPRGAAIAHRMPAAVPVIEIADDADPLRIGRPDGEMNAAKALMGPDVGTEPLVIAVVRPFAQQVQVKIGEDRPEEIGIDEIPRMPLVVFHREPIGKSAVPAGEAGHEKTIRVNSLHRDPLARLALASGRRPRPTLPRAGRRGRPRYSRAAASAGSS